jgi:hypothetical protein
MTFHWPLLFVCLLKYLHACQRTFRIYKNNRFLIFSWMWHLSFFTSLLWYPGIEYLPWFVQYLFVSILLLYYHFVLNHLLLYPLLIPIAKDWFGGSSH